MCPAKSIKQQKFMGMVHAAQKGELKDASPAVKKAAKSMKKKDAEDFAATKHKGLPEKVKETFVPETLNSFSNESREEPDEEYFIDSLMTSLIHLGLNDEEADFAIGELDDSSIRDWAREFEMNPRVIDPIAEDVIKYVFQK
jgi:hypothetical protein